MLKHSSDVIELKAASGTQLVFTKKLATPTLQKVMSRNTASLTDVGMSFFTTITYHPFSLGRCASSEASLMGALLLERAKTQGLLKLWSSLQLLPVLAF